MRDGTGTGGPVASTERSHPAWEASAASSITAVGPGSAGGWAENSRSWQGPSNAYFEGPFACLKATPPHRPLQTTSPQPASRRRSWQTTSPEPASRPRSWQPAAGGRVLVSRVSSTNFVHSPVEIDPVQHEKRWITQWNKSGKKKPQFPLALLHRLDYLLGI